MDLESSIEQAKGLLATCENDLAKLKKTHGNESYAYGAMQGRITAYENIIEFMTRTPPSTIGVTFKVDPSPKIYKG